jgi:Uma2 family endonuclease
MATTARTIDEELPKGLDIAAFLDWVKDRPGRFELHDGYVVAMAPERIVHAQMKAAAWIALGKAIAKAGVPCHALPDGVGVKVGDRKWYQPDAMVYCGTPASPDDLFIANPMIIVEVSSPSTSTIDEQQKLAGYFSLPSVQHYLIAYADGPLVHHKRQADGTILTRLVSGGTLKLDPPGIEFDVSELFA